MTKLHPEKFKQELKKRTLKYMKAGCSMLDTMEKVAFDMQKVYGISADIVIKKVKDFRLKLNKG